ncbi:alkyl sulfatase dimerization domain-containing protein [Cupriavidus sp. IDO]|uniref:alkyl sulfatase dimerization domain-containing protein n=1 Tax=Cupriavidus sp. IDO TaxID=1539142 RepID=UPI003FCECCA8
MAWYDANPSDLNDLPPEMAAKKYVKYMSGEAAILRRAKAVWDKGDRSAFLRCRSRRDSRRPRRHALPKRHPCKPCDRQRCPARLKQRTTAWILAYSGTAFCVPSSFPQPSGRSGAKGRPVFQAA